MTSLCMTRTMGQQVSIVKHQIVNVNDARPSPWKKHNRQRNTGVCDIPEDFRRDVVNIKTTLDPSSVKIHTHTHTHSTICKDQCRLIDLTIVLI